MSRILLAAVLLLLPLAPLHAADDAKTRAEIAARFPGTEAGDVRPSPVDGLYEVMVGPVVIYVSSDGRYMFRGKLLDMKTDTNLTERRESEARSRVLGEIPDSELITYSTKGKPRHTITVFTDTSCTYCREFHQQIDQYNALGIKVRYAFFPRNGLASGNWKEMERVACAADRKQALTAAKQDQPFESRSCQDNPVMDHWQLGRMLGVRGTPAMFTESGRMIPGYLPPEQLLKALEDYATRDGR